MDLFNTDKIINLLPYDGVVNYQGKIFRQKDADYYLHCLLHTVEWKNDEAVIFGKRIITKRKVAWYGNSGYSYTYSNTTKKALEWTKELLELKQTAEEFTDSKFNSCLLNLYHNGEEGVGWHSDNENSLARNATIASLSFGAERKFFFRHKKTKDIVSVILEHGSLLAMKGATQANWLHCLPKSSKITEPRINLTFRLMAG